MPELDKKTPAMVRKGRIFREIVRGLSWGNEIRVQVPAALWTLIKDGWHAGPLVKSMNGIKDPELSGVVWTAWQFGAVFGTDCIYIQSNKMAAHQFISLRDIAVEARANPGDTPTDGI